MFVLTINGTEFRSEQDLQILEAKQTYFGTSQVKFIFKGKVLQDDLSLSDYFEQDVVAKVMLVKSTQSELERQQELKDKQSRASKNYQRALNSRPKHNETSMGYCKLIEPLNGFSDIEKARVLLAKIRDDAGIKLIMKNREWRVTRLIELHPNEKTILGYNQNKGQIIALRLRLDDLSGFRDYSSIIKVMLHELAHMIFSEHDQHFHALDRLLNQEYARYSKKHIMGEHSKGFGSENYISGIVGDTQKLGGREFEGENQREIMLKAVEQRLTREEKEMESACGLSKH